MGMGSLLVGIVVGAIGYSTVPTVRPLADRASEHLVPTAKYLGEALVYLGELLK